MTTESEAAARQAEVFLAGKRTADNTAGLLREALRELGIRAGEPEGWPQVEGRAAVDGTPSVYLGSVPLPTARKLCDALITACLEDSRRRHSGT
ncbi:hypothetical protein [Streptomyces aidingensis]|uniref:Uncharacterized protein n=1 Tax=Streptomyces aidingensis TaxID=910347 RepID=A0A1I1FCS0_9ACTN|nr:hypothetical protein [Streptomyces aidingensis]SFB97269.1 hypothetical protein SAMN05421773_101687 [Streptomyces aidingensis]